MTLTSSQINQSLFQISDPGKVYINTSFEENLQTLLNGIKEKKKIFLISGKQGSGKQTLIQKAIYDLDNKAFLVNIKDELLDYEKLVDYIGKSLDNNFLTSVSLEEKLTLIKELLKKKSIQHVLFAFDQSTELKRTVIENGLLLVNSSLSDSCFFHLVITGLPGLSDQLKQSGFPSSVLIDTCYLQIEPLPENNIHSYIQHHLQHLENQGENIFSKEAVNRIIKYSKGLPGLINRLCSLGLLTANLEEKSSVSVKMVDEVLENSLFLGNEFDYTPSTQDKSFSVDEFLDDSVTFNNSVSQPPVTPRSPKPAKPIDEFEKQTLQQRKLAKKKSVKADATVLSRKHDIHIPNKHKTEKPKSVHAEATVVSRKDNSKPKELDLDKLIHSTRVEKRDSVKYKSRKKRKSSKKSPLFSAFSMGVIFSTLICTGLYFFLFKNQETPENQLAISNSDSLNEKNKFSPQQLEARLNYLEQQLKEQRSVASNQSKTELSERKAIDYVAKLPATAAGTSKKEQAVAKLDKKITDQIKVNELSENQLPQEEKDENIQQLLLSAKHQLDNKKLMTPVNDSAWTTYKKILSLDPDNQDAVSGITKIRDTYISWARHEIKKGNPKHATFLFKKALQVSPGDPEILSAIVTLEGKKPTRARKNSAFSEINLFNLLDTPKGIEKLLAIAELQISRRNLTTPDNNSAFTIYKIILNRFPGHTSALSGMETIKETYVAWAKHEIELGNYMLAESLYSKALKVAPADPEIVSNLDQLRKTINQYSR